jgi:4-aminobutyrate aminotransferase-like enzyme
VTAQAGLKVLEILKRDSLAERSARLGTTLKNRLKGLCEMYDTISDVRGIGLMVGVEISGTSRHSASECTDLILERMKDAGYFLGKTGPGRNVVTWMPPLIVGEEELMKAAETFENVVQAEK